MLYPQHYANQRIEHITNTLPYVIDIVRQRIACALEVERKYRLPALNVLTHSIRETEWLQNPKKDAPDHNNYFGQMGGSALIYTREEARSKAALLAIFNKDGEKVDLPTVKQLASYLWQCYGWRYCAEYPDMAASFDAYGANISTNPAYDGVRAAAYANDVIGYIGALCQSPYQTACPFESDKALLMDLVIPALLYIANHDNSPSCNMAAEILRNAKIVLELTHKEPGDFQLT